MTNLLRFVFLYELGRDKILRLNIEFSLMRVVRRCGPLHIQESQDRFSFGFIRCLGDRSAFGSEPKGCHPFGILFVLKRSSSPAKDETIAPTDEQRINVSFIPSIEGISKRMMYFFDAALTSGRTSQPFRGIFSIGVKRCCASLQ